MGNLNGYDADNHEPLSDFEPIPAGDYRVIAVSSEMKETAKGTGEYLQIEWDIVEGDYKERKLWSRLNLDNPNPKAVAIAQRELSSICRATGVMRPNDSSELHDIPIILRVGITTRKDNGEPTNRIKKYLPAGNAPAPSAAPNTTPPWSR